MLCIFFEKGFGGVAALVSNMAEFNRLQASITQDILTRLGEMSDFRLFRQGRHQVLEDPAPLLEIPEAVEGSRTIAGLRSFPEKVILIAGGKDKGISYAPLGPVARTPRRSRTSSIRCSTPPKVRAKARTVSSGTKPWTAQMAAM